MRICIDISQIIYRTGVSRYTEELVKHLLKIDRENQYLLFGTSFRRFGQLKNFLLRFHSLDYETARFKPKLYPIPVSVWEILANRLRFLPIEFFSGKIDIFHSSDWTEPKSTAKKVTTIHDLAIFKFPQNFDPKIISVHKRKLEWVKTECAKVIAVSKNTKKDIIEILKIPEEKIVVIYEGVSDSFKAQSAEDIERVRNKFGIKKDCILTVATKGARKNLAKLFEAFNLIKKDFDLDLVVAGTNQINDKKDIITTGFLEDKELAALYSGARVFVFPSTYEGFGLPVLEAMSCGCPVVVSQTSSLPEVGGEAAVYLDPNSEENIAEGVMKVLMDKKFAQELSELGLKQASKFSWEKTASETSKIYEEFL